MRIKIEPYDYAQSSFRNHHINHKIDYTKISLFGETFYRNPNANQAKIVHTECVYKFIKITYQELKKFHKIIKGS